MGLSFWAGNQGADAVALNNFSNRNRNVFRKLASFGNPVEEEGDACAGYPRLVDAHRRQTGRHITGQQNIVNADQRDIRWNIQAVLLEILQAADGNKVAGAKNRRRDFSSAFSIAAAFKGNFIAIRRGKHPFRMI